MGAISERDEKCKLDMERIEGKIGGADSLKSQVHSYNSITSKQSIGSSEDLSVGEKKEL